MNKVLHVLVYVFLALAGAGLYFELELDAKRTELTDRNRLQEDFLIKIAKTIEEESPAKDAAFEIKKDASPVEAKLVDSPDMENVLDEYQASLEQTNLKTFDWSGKKDQLRAVYVLGPDGKPEMDGNQPRMEGPGTEQELLNRLFEGAKAQQSRLNSTRAALTELRSKVASMASEVNKIKPDARQDKVTIEEQKAKMTKLEEEKTALENQVTKIKGQIDELNGEITSLKDEVSTAKDETDAAKEETAKAQKLIEQLKKLLQESIQTQGTASQGSSVAVASLPYGDKGVLIQADNENMFAIVKFSDEALKELKGGKEDSPVAMLELGVRRAGYKGKSGEFIGRLRIRQEVKGKPYVICDILGAWKQADMAKGDAVFAD